MSPRSHRKSTSQSAVAVVSRFAVPLTIAACRASYAENCMRRTDRSTDYIVGSQKRSMPQPVSMDGQCHRLAISTNISTAAQSMKSDVPRYPFVHSVSMTFSPGRAPFGALNCTADRTAEGRRIGSVTFEVRRLLSSVKVRVLS
jgi:hypothetical protein